MPNWTQSTRFKQKPQPVEHIPPILKETEKVPVTDDKEAEALSAEYKQDRFDRKMEQFIKFPYSPLKVEVPDPDNPEKSITVHANSVRDILAHGISVVDGWRLGDVARRNLKSWIAESDIAQLAFIEETHMEMIRQRLVEAEKDNQNNQKSHTVLRLRRLYEASTNFHAVLITILHDVQIFNVARGIDSEEVRPKIITRPSVSDQVIREWLEKGMVPGAGGYFKSRYSEGIG